MTVVHLGSNGRPRLCGDQSFHIENRLKLQPSQFGHFIGIVQHSLESSRSVAQNEKTELPHIAPAVHPTAKMDSLTDVCRGVDGTDSHS